MKRFIPIIIFLYISIIGYAQEEVHKFDNLFYISVSEDLELRKKDDAYNRILHDSLNYVADSVIVFQLKELSNKSKDTLSNYYMIMISIYKNKNGAYPSYDESSFTDNYLKILLSNTQQELEPGQHFVINPKVSIERTYSNATFVQIHYTRTGTNGDVNVDICYYYNYDSAVKAIFSYRESEAKLWKNKLAKSLKSFAWANPYALNINLQKNNLLELIKGTLSETKYIYLSSIIGIILITTLLYFFNRKKYKNTKQLKKDIFKNISLIEESIQQKKVVSAGKLLNKINTTESKRFKKLYKNISELDFELGELIEKVSQEVDSQIENVKKDFLNNPAKNITPELSNFLKDNEIPIIQKEKIIKELKELEEKYEKGVSPKQRKEIVNYNIEQSKKNGFYSFFYAPSSNTEIYPYRRQKVELRGFSEEDFEKKLCYSLGKSCNYDVLGDVSILTSEGNHPFEPDIAIIERCYKYGVRIDIEIDEPYGGYDKTPIHFIGCGDDFRDRRLANLGWLVIRFSEKQIIQEPDNCINFIKYLLSLIDPFFNKTYKGNFPTPDKCWTEVEAKIMAIQRFRENLLNHQFGIKNNKRNIDSTSLTDLEKDIAKHAKPIYFPNSVKHNLDKSNLIFFQDSKLSFEPFEHIYLYDGQIPFTAVSNIIKQFFTPFDSIGISMKIASRDHLSQCKVLEDFDCKGVESREVGTFLHSQIEAFFLNNPLSMNTQFNYNGNYIKITKNIAIDKEISYFKNFIKENSIKPFRTEWHIYDPILKIAGTIDLLCRNGKHFDIYDWKRSKKVSPNATAFKNGINGLEHLPDISFNHYALQQNLYKYILEKNYNVFVENMYIVVLHPNFGNYQLFKIPDMSKEINIIKKYIN